MIVGARSTGAWVPTSPYRVLAFSVVIVWSCAEPEVNAPQSWIDAQPDTVVRRSSWIGTSQREQSPTRQPILTIYLVTFLVQSLITSITESTFLGLGENLPLRVTPHNHEPGESAAVLTLEVPERIPE